MAQSGMMKGMAEVAEEAAKLDGAPVLQITHMGSSAQAISDFSTARGGSAPAGAGRPGGGSPDGDHDQAVRIFLRADRPVQVRGPGRFQAGRGRDAEGDPEVTAQ